ncbi:MAG: cob(I)yrinic acid a,c-diamide adenosyltransferase [Candidatus Rokubacteria bacterium]|nr:cob(I)yrinic acid a,c-diamide adenosyltransferase [Candidatus Rokubacteria bacterium]
MARRRGGRGLGRDDGRRRARHRSVPRAREEKVGMTRERRGLVLCYTGDGKGKTTAALGLTVRAVGAGLRVRLLQFIKGEWKPAELKGLALLGAQFSMEQLGIGFVRYQAKHTMEEQIAAAEKAWTQARAEMQAGDCDVLILDEINNAFRFGLLDPSPVVEALRARPEALTVVLTGRGAPPAIVDEADLVTEMRMVKHPYQQGRQAQYGIDF